MYFIPGFLISFLTFPGVIVHELGHVLFCRLRRVPVLEACYFRADMKVQGYVIHAEPADYASAFLISAGPLLLNTLLCLLICLPASIPFHAFGVRDFPTLLLLWLGLSIGMHAFPSTQDASNLWAATKAAAGERNPLAILGYPLTGLIYLANLLRFFWFDAIYGFAVGVLLPYAVFKAL